MTMSSDREKAGHIELGQPDDVVRDKKAEIARLNKLLTQVHRFDKGSLLKLEDMLFDCFFKAGCHLSISMLNGHTKGTGAYAMVIDKLHFVLRDIAVRRKLVEESTADGKIIIGYERELPGEVEA